MYILLKEDTTCFVFCSSTVHIAQKTRLPCHQLTWKCTDPCRKTTFLLERAFLHFHVSWWQGKFLKGCVLRTYFAPRAEDGMNASKAETEKKARV